MKNQALATLVAAIILDSIVDKEEVTQLKECILEDGVIDREEADALFEINDAVSGNENDPGYNDLFVESILAHVLEDEETPGVVDQSEGDWLAGKLEADGELDDLEIRLLKELETKATKIESERLNALVELAKTQA